MLKARPKGTAAIELALLLPILLLLTLVTTEFGRAILEYNTVVKSVRNATRYLATRTPIRKHLKPRIWWFLAIRLGPDQRWLRA